MNFAIMLFTFLICSPVILLGFIFGVLWIAFSVGMFWATQFNHKFMVNQK